MANWKPYMNDFDRALTKLPFCGCASWPTEAAAVLLPRSDLASGLVSCRYRTAVYGGGLFTFCGVSALCQVPRPDVLFGLKYQACDLGE